MSSHHIVRDKQEPALIIANGESCSNELMGQLLEWSPYVIVLDGAIRRVLNLQIKFDVLLGDFDSNTILTDSHTLQDSIEIIHTPDQNKTDLEKAIDFLIERGHKAVNVIWATGRRADHTIANITGIVRFKNKIPKLPGTFTKWYPENSKISLIPIGDVQGIETENLVYNLHKEDLNLGYKISSSNVVAKDGLVKIVYKTGDLIMMECVDYKID
jgi:thiamine pyrophosphokinase